jgi:hypothetical protein
MSPEHDHLAKQRDDEMVELSETWKVQVRNVTDRLRHSPLAAEPRTFAPKRRKPAP